MSPFDEEENEFQDIDDTIYRFPMGDHDAVSAHTFCGNVLGHSVSTCKLFFSVFAFFYRMTLT